MKKVISTAFTILFISSILNAQEEPAKKSIDKQFYLSTGLSISNSGDTTFAYSSYPSVEAGLMVNNFSLGLVMGRSSLSGFDADDISNYWYEIKTALSFPINKFSGYGLIGIGNYLNTSRIFIEYGGGFSYSFNKMSLYMQVSNWDGVWYATPGISYTF